MPLRAKINDEDIIAPFVDEEAWIQLKHRVKHEGLDVLLPCCGNNASLRTNKHGLNYFVHKERGNCSSASDTWQHLKAKYDIALACRAAGYEAITEATGNGWQADVLAQRDRAQAAFGVQWNTQIWEVTQERQKRYKDAGMRGCWFFKTPPRQYSANRDVPLFKLDITEEAATVVFNPYSYESWREYSNRSVPLRDFVTALLTGKIRYCDQLRSQQRQKVRIVFVEIDCWKCHQPFHVYYINSLKTGCGESIESDEFAREIIAAVLQFKNSPGGQHLRIGQIKKRYSRTMNERYMSFGCPHCDSIVGNFFLYHEIIPEAVYSEDEAPAILETETSFDDLLTTPAGHWCFPENEQFCCG